MLSSCRKEVPCTQYSPAEHRTRDLSSHVPLPTPRLYLPALHHSHPLSAEALWLAPAPAGHFPAGTQTLSSCVLLSEPAGVENSTSEFGHDVFFAAQRGNVDICSDLNEPGEQGVHAKAEAGSLKVPRGHTIGCFGWPTGFADVPLPCRVPRVGPERRVRWPDSVAAVLPADMYRWVVAFRAPRCQKQP